MPPSPLNPSFESFELGPQKRDDLRAWLSSDQGEVIPFLSDPDRASLIAALGIQREIGGPNDEFGRFVFDADTGEAIERSALSGHLIRWRNFVGVQIRDRQERRLAVHIRGFADLLHPGFSAPTIFPHLVAMILQRRGIEAVLVRRWGLNSVFGGFDPKKDYYQANMWELLHNDGLLYAQLVSRGQLALLGTHDFAGHVAGSNAAAWSRLRSKGETVHAQLQKFFGESATGNLPSLLLSYAIGTVFDDLAQPVNYDSAGHIAVLNGLLAILNEDVVDPQWPSVIQNFPVSFEKLIRAARENWLESQPEELAQLFLDFKRDLSPA